MKVKPLYFLLSDPRKASETAAEVWRRLKSRLVNLSLFQVLSPGCLALLRVEQGELSLCTVLSALAFLALRDAYLKCQSDFNTKITENLFTIPYIAQPKQG